MTEHTPDSLAQRTDALRAGADPGSDPLEQAAARLLNAPAPALSPDAYARIQARVMATRPTPPLLRPLPAGVALAGVVALLVVIGIISARPSDIPATPPAPSPVHTLTIPAATISPSPTATPSATPAPSYIVIEGEVQAINGNVVTVYGVDVTLPADHPLLSVLRVGDVVRVEGHIPDDSMTLTLTADDVQVVTDDDSLANSPDGGAVWRDDGSCANPPPDWAPAVGWRRRCQPGTAPPNADPPGRGNGDGDDDDD